MTDNQNGNLLGPLASAVELVAILAISYSLRQVMDELDVPLVVFALTVPLAEIALVWGLLRRRGLRLAAVGWKWQRPDTKQWLSIGLAAIAVFAVYYLIRPLIADLTGQDLDLSTFDRIRGNTPLLLFGFIQAWILAAFREELFYRGFIMTRVAGLVPAGALRWPAAISIQAVIFGLAHSYQGPTGMIVSGLAGLVFGVLVYRLGRRLLPAMVAHGAVDSFALIAIYAGIPLF